MKSLFNFYLDDQDKEKAQQKLVRLCGEQSKGMLAAFYRVVTKMFLATPDEKVEKLFVESLAAEWEFTQKQNKRSRL